MCEYDLHLIRTISGSKIKPKVVRVLKDSSLFLHLRSDLSESIIMLPYW